MTGMNFFSGSSLPGIIMHIGHNPSRTTAVSIEDVEFEHCVFGGGEYRVPNPALSGGGRIAGVKLGVRAITQACHSPCALLVLCFRSSRHQRGLFGIIRLFSCDDSAT